MAQCQQISRYQQYLDNRPISEGLYQKVVLKCLQNLIPLLVVFFSIANVSLRRLQYFCTEILNYSVFIGQVKQIIETTAHNAEGYLANWDRIAEEKAEILEFDTTWKGRMRKFFGVIAKKYRYLFVLQPIRNEHAATLQPILEQLAKTCINVKYIITDMVIGFKQVIRKVFANSLHLFCHVHIFRLFHREWGEERKKFGKSRTRLHKAKGPVETTRKWMQKILKRWQFTTNYLHKMQKTKHKMCQRLGIKVRTSGGISHTRGGLHPSLKPISKRIYRTVTKVHRLLKQTRRQQRKLVRTTEKYVLYRNQYWKEWSQLMIPAKIHSLLKITFHAETLGKFKQNLLRLKRKLRQSSVTGARKLLNILNSSPVNNIARTFLDQTVEKFSISTNTIEGYFAQCRMLLDEVRNAPDTEYIRSRLTLLRYWHNSIGPLSGFEKDTSPYSRVGIKIDSTNPIRLICINIRME